MKQIAFRIKYIVALLLIALFSGLFYISNIFMINSYAHYAKIINSSGKERMLTVKAHMDIDHYLHTGDAEYLHRVEKTIEKFNEVEAYLMASGYASAQEEKKKYFSHAEIFIDTQEYKSYEYISANTEPLLSKIDDFVFSIQIESEKKMETIKNYELYILTGLFLLLAAEAYLIFIPAEREMASKTKELTDINASLEKRIRDEVAKNKAKDKIVMEQSKMAAMGEMIGNIAHQWRQPLNALGLVIANIHNAYTFGRLDDAFLEKSVTKAQGLAEGMSQTIDDFRNFYSPDRDKSCFNAKEAVEGTINIMEGLFANNSIQIKNHIDNTSVICGYHNEFSQVVLNILSNAKDVFTERGISNPVVEISSKEEDGCLQLIFCDNAGGIPEDVIERIFEPYFTTKEQGHGTGIGLYMSKIIIEKHMKGKLNVRNTDRGAEFIIELPNPQE